MKVAESAKRALPGRSNNLILTKTVKKLTVSAGGKNGLNGYIIDTRGVAGAVDIHCNIAESCQGLRVIFKAKNAKQTSVWSRIMRRSPVRQVITVKCHKDACKNLVFDRREPGPTEPTSRQMTYSTRIVLNTDGVTAPDVATFGDQKIDHGVIFEWGQCPIFPKNDPSQAIIDAVNIFMYDPYYDLGNPFIKATKDDQGEAVFADLGHAYMKVSVYQLLPSRPSFSSQVGYRPLEHDLHLNSEFWKMVTNQLCLATLAVAGPVTAVAGLAVAAAADLPITIAIAVDVLSAAKTSAVLSAAGFAEYVKEQMAGDDQGRSSTFCGPSWKPGATWEGWAMSTKFPTHYTEDRTDKGVGHKSAFVEYHDYGDFNFE